MQRLDLSDRGTGRQVLDVQRRAYRVEAELIGFHAIPPLHESLADLLAGDQLWIGIRVEGRVAAALAYRLDDAGCDIDRLFVDPDEARKDFASALLAALLHHPRVTVSTATGNTPARRLYEKHGFQAAGQRPIGPSVTATQYVRCR